MIRRRAAGRFGFAVALRPWAAITIGTRSAIAIRAWSAITVHSRPAVAAGLWAAITIHAGLAFVAFGGATVTFDRGLANLVTFTAILATELIVGRTATGLVEVFAGGLAAPAALAPNILPALPTLHRPLHTGARAHAGNHRAKALDGFLGQLVAHLCQGVDASDGGVGFKLGSLHEFLTDQSLIGFVRQRNLRDLTAQAHEFFPDALTALVGLEETAQRRALLIVEVAEKFLWIELRVWLAALVFIRPEVTALAVRRTTLATRVALGIALRIRLWTEVLSPAATVSGFSALRLGTLIVAGLEFAARRTLAFGGAFVASALLCAAGTRQGRE